MSENFFEEEYEDDQYITEEDYDELQEDNQVFDDELVEEYDTITGTVNVTLSENDLSNIDSMRERKIFDALKNNDFSNKSTNFSEDKKWVFLGIQIM